MSPTPPGEGQPKPFDMEAYEKSLKNVTEVAEILANKLTHEEMYYVVLAIEDSDFHDAIIRKWQSMEHPKPNIES